MVFLVFSNARELRYIPLTEWGRRRARSLLAYADVRYCGATYFLPPDAERIYGGEYKVIESEIGDEE